jgi:AraC family ethanolamine operon transcriptional activator
MNPAAARPIAVQCKRADDIDQHTQQLQDWDLQYDQLDHGRFEWRFTDIRWPGMQLFVEQTTRRVRQRGHLLPDSCGIGTLIEGDGPMRVNGLRSDTGTLVACDSAELDLCTPAGCTLAGLVIDARALHDIAERMPELGPLRHPGRLRALTPPAPALARWQTLLTDSARAIVERPEMLHSPAMQEHLHDELLSGLIDAMTAAQPAEQVQTPDARKRVVDRACELMLSQPDEPLSLLEVCRRIGASPRKLGYCFQDVLGLSPARYIKAMRLNAARRMLARGDDPALSVYDVAARWGFWHFGHFSTDYKKQFFEQPSETLRRARVRSAR